MVSQNTQFVGLVLMCFVAFATGAPADEPLSTGDRDSIRSVIESQLDAFRRDDADDAFSFAAPIIREKFGNAVTFIEMVRTGYRPVYRPSEVVFRDIDMSGTLPIQEVLVVDREGGSFIAHYPMQRQPDGHWLIAGCFLSPFEGEST